ncbi:hypothetical protein M3Y99_01085800 [Aphelenchoides fujianensis]|nr:hypothetical protein M3Y99_01085800 [Aphelenchoides fujianensis]
MTAGASPTPNLLPNSSGGGHGSGVTSRPPNLKLTVGERSVVRRTDREFRRNSSQLHLLFGRSHLPPMLQAKFGSQDQNSEDGGSAPLITKLDKYSAEELKEYRLVFNVFDADRSGAIGLDEMENAIINLGMDPKQFCEVMKTMSEKTKSWNEVIRDCFTVFDRNETGVITRKDFEFILRELGHIDNSTLMGELG